MRRPSRRHAPVRRHRLERLVRWLPSAPTHITAYRLSYGRVRTAGRTRRPDTKPRACDRGSSVEVIDRCKGRPTPSRGSCTPGAVRATASTTGECVDLYTLMSQSRDTDLAVHF